MVDLENLKSDGYLTNEGQERQNVFFKLVQPLGSNTTLAVVAMVNHIHQGISLGATRNEIDTLVPIGAYRTTRHSRLLRLQPRPHHDRFRIYGFGLDFRFGLGIGHESLHLRLLPSRLQR